MLKKLILAACLVVGLGLLIGTGARAYSMQSGETAVMGKDQIVDGPLYIAGSAVRVEGTVNGDLFCAGQTVEVTGIINGDVLCAAQQLTIKGAVNGDVRAAAQTILAEGRVSGSVTAFAQSFRLANTGNVGADATVFAQTATFDGNVARDVVGGGGNVTLNAAVGGNVKLDVQTLSVGGTANVTGGINYTSRNEANVQQGAQVGGLNRSEPTAKHDNQTQQNPLLTRVTSAIFWFLSALIVGGALMLVAPRLFDRSAEGITQRPWFVLALGLLAVFVTPILLIFLATTVIGIPLALVLLLVWILALMVAGVFTGYTLGKLILDRDPKAPTGRARRFGFLALGVFILAVLAVIPVINVFAGLLTLLFGTGSLLNVLSNRPATKPAK